MSMLLAQSLLLLFVLTARDTPQLSTLSLHDALPILRLRVLSPVLEYRTARHHLQVRQLGEAVDDAFRDAVGEVVDIRDRKSTSLNSSHLGISYAVFCLKKKTIRAHVVRAPKRGAGQQ